MNPYQLKSKDDKNLESYIKDADIIMDKRYLYFAFNSLVNTTYTLLYLTYHRVNMLK